MDLNEAILERHSVRQYKNEPLKAEDKEKLIDLIEGINNESGLHIQLVCDEPKAFESKMAKYGKFSGVTNYVALIGKKQPNLDEKCGYYGQRIVLEAQTMGLNTCWVASSYKKISDAYTVDKGEKLTVVIAIGYGETEGKKRKSKKPEDVCYDIQSAPHWFKRGIDAALLAPTAMNQQKFTFNLDGISNRVKAKAGIGPYSKVDLGIAKYNFEVGAGKKNFEWAGKNTFEIRITD
ncbi:MAG: nitroreductase [Eubacterium sp.]|nr:nitroreductase [Eubacterium sp.]